LQGQAHRLLVLSFFCCLHRVNSDTLGGPDGLLRSLTPQLLRAATTATTTTTTAYSFLICSAAAIAFDLNDDGSGLRLRLHLHMALAPAARAA
jgi:hypothetical protein